MTSGQNISRRPIFLVLSGPSGVGKDSVAKILRILHPDLVFTVNVTSRPPRPYEIEGVDHHFVDETKFLELVDSDALLEYARVYGYWYGVPKKQVLDALGRGLDVIARVDIQGAATIKSNAPDAILVFLEPPSLGELERRLKGRRTESEDELTIRLKVAGQEMAESTWFDYVIVNDTDSSEQTARQIFDILAREGTIPKRHF